MPPPPLLLPRNTYKQHTPAITTVHNLVDIQVELTHFIQNRGGRTSQMLFDPSMVGVVHLDHAYYLQVKSMPFQQMTYTCRLRLNKKRTNRPGELLRHLVKYFSLARAAHTKNIQTYVYFFSLRSFDFPSPPQHSARVKFRVNYIVVTLPPLLRT